jgi:hypothetical protein
VNGEHIQRSSCACGGAHCVVHLLQSIPLCQIVLKALHWRTKPSGLISPTLGRFLTYSLYPNSLPDQCPVLLPHRCMFSSNTSGTLLICSPFPPMHSVSLYCLQQVAHLALTLIPTTVGCAGSECMAVLRVCGCSGTLLSSSSVSSSCTSVSEREVTCETSSVSLAVCSAELRSRTAARCGGCRSAGGLTMGGGEEGGGTRRGSGCTVEFAAAAVCASTSDCTMAASEVTVAVSAAKSALSGSVLSTITAEGCRTAPPDREGDGAWTCGEGLPGFDTSAACFMLDSSSCGGGGRSEGWTSRVMSRAGCKADPI